MDIATTLTEIATVCSTAGMNTYTVPPTAYDTPAVVIYPPETISYVKTFSGRAEMTLTVELVVSAVDPQSAWTLLYSHLSYKSGALVYSLMTHNPTSYKQLQVTQSRSPVQVSDDVHLTAELSLTIIF